MLAEMPQLDDHFSHVCVPIVEVLLLVSTRAAICAMLFCQRSAIFGQRMLSVSISATRSLGPRFSTRLSKERVITAQQKGPS